MAKFYESIAPELQDFIVQQKMFFTATAISTGRVNLSPKGMDTFRVLDDRTVAYLDLTGSGNETSAHLLVDPRMTVMFCGFEEKPWIVRLYGRGKVVRSSDADWAILSRHFELLPGTRQIIQIQVDSAQSSCGMAVPKYEFQGHRNELLQWAEKKGESGVQQYWKDRNQISIDGLMTNIGQELAEDDSRRPIVADR
jgi:Pyridoxamine 5'-phosphate oxidase